MRGALTRRVLDLLARLASEEAEKYQTFWNEFGRVLKEGLAEDPANRERIAKLLRFSSTHTDREQQDQSLEDYRKRMQPARNASIYLVAEDFAAARSSPHLEVYRRKGVEVLLLGERTRRVAGRSSAGVRRQAPARRDARGSRARWRYSPRRTRSCAKRI